MEGCVEMSEKLQIKPYARLITMLGDQLIKNELIALVELIKNSYDADASWVKVSFVDFADDFSLTDNSKIVIEDDGCGMDENILKKHWLNPATPVKLKLKETNRAKTLKGRILQGEKGIGRFSIFKLGKNIKITTRRQLQDENGKFINGEAEDIENILIYDFGKYDDDFLTENGEEKDLYLENLIVEISQRSPMLIKKSKVKFGTTVKDRNPYGTIIEISDLKSRWTKASFDRIQDEIGKLQPIFGEKDSNKVVEFSVWVYKNKQLYISPVTYKEELKNILEHKAVFKVENGKYIANNNRIEFTLNGRLKKLNFDDSDIKGLNLFKKLFGNPNYKTECGNFEFEFYIFDLNASSDNLSKYILDRREKQIIRDHRIYLYRDNIRVMPYGDPLDDWLGIDVARGTISASAFLSNDQVVGCVYITQDGNPKLKDKTNREGLIEDGKALHDFVGVLQIILKYLRSNQYTKYLVEKKRKREEDALKNGQPLELIKSAKDKYSEDKNVMAFLQNFESSYKIERKILDDRIRKTENLAAVGLSVETASHDVMLFLRKCIDQQDALIKDVMSGGDIDRENLLERLTIIKGNLSMIESQMRDVQLLFPSTKSRTKNINVKEIIEKVYRLYKRPFGQSNILVDIVSTKQPLIVKTTDAVLLQVFINLFDNALYWVRTVDDERQIKIYIDGEDNRVIFSDSGPGIKEEDKNYIFEAFYSGKGEDGRGLGLYIAKQLLDRYDYSIDLAEFSKDKLLKGANFVLEFIKEG